MPKTYTPVEMVIELCRFDTTSSRSNLELIRFVEDYLSGYGITSDIMRSPEGDKANLFATFGPKEEGGVILSGHTDVVPVTGQAWDTDPFDPVVKDDRIYGRGTTDMKSFAAVILALVPEIVERDLKYPLHLALSYDEEVGCLGVHGLVAQLGRQLPRPRAVIVGEPTSMKVVDSHKGIMGFCTRVTGKEAHSSATHVGVNAVEIAARLIGWLGELGADLRAAGDPTGRFDPPYTTVHVGMISGGTALNIIPKHCEFLWEFRALPGEDGDVLLKRFKDYAISLLPEMRARFDGANIETTSKASIPSLFPDPGSEAEKLALHLARANHTEAVSYGTEGGIFQAADIPTVICGPGDILQAHAPNEFIALSQIEACTDFIRRLIDHAADPG